MSLKLCSFLTPWHTLNQCNTWYLNGLHNTLYIVNLVFYLYTTYSSNLLGVFVVLLESAVFVFAVHLSCCLACVCLCAEGILSSFVLEGASLSGAFSAGSRSVPGIGNMTGGSSGGWNSTGGALVRFLSWEWGYRCGTSSSGRCDDGRLDHPSGVRCTWLGWWLRILSP